MIVTQKVAYSFRVSKRIASTNTLFDTPRSRRTCVFLITHTKMAVSLPDDRLDNTMRAYKVLDEAVSTSFDDLSNLPRQR